MTSKSLDVAVIGIGTAGVSGLRWCKARNLNVVGFDKEAVCGGIWRCGTAHSPAYDSLYTNSSSVMMCLGDFDQRLAGKFPRHSETCRYYTEYMKLYDLDKLVKWKTIVERVYKEGERWVVQYRSVDNLGDSHQTTFDRVLVCTGMLWNPSYPSWVKLPPGQNEETKIDILHSRDYRNPQRFAGKKVVVVGVGNSALDISLELARDPNVQKPVLVSCRRGTVVMPIDDGRGDPVDPTVTSRAFQYLASAKTRAKMMVNNAQLINEQFRKLGLPPPPNTSNLFAVENPVSNLKDSRGYLSALREGLIQFVDGVVGFHGESSLCTQSGTTTQDNIDAVIFSTGYRVGLDFLEPSIRSKIVRNVIQKSGQKTEYVDLFKNMLFAPDPSLAFLVFLTSYGNESVVGSLQARWISKFWIDESFAKKTFSFAKFEKESSDKLKFVIASNTPNPYFVRKSFVFFIS